MNYLIIQNNEYPKTCLPIATIVQMFSDDDLMAMSLYIQREIVDEEQFPEEIRRIFGTLLHLLGQWDHKTQHVRKRLKDSLALCNTDQQLVFKRMYSHKDLDKDINQVVDDMNTDHLDWAILQVEKTIKKNVEKVKTL